MVRDARAALPDFAGGFGPDRGPLEAVKAIYAWGAGRLASRTGRSKDLAEDPLFQPYWAWAIIAEARARLHRRLSATKTGPVAIEVDCAWFLTRHASPELFAVREGLPLGESLGQFKSAGACSGAEARDAHGHSNAINRLRELVK